MKKRIRQCFGKAAASYGDAASVQREVAARCAALCSAGNYGSVLDIGSGVGFLHDELKQGISFDRYVSPDLVPEMIAEQRKANTAALVVADGENLPFAGETFDLLVSSSAMQWYSDPRASIPANLKALKRGGKFAIAIFTKGTLGELADVSEKTGFGSVKELMGASFYEEIFNGIDGIEVRFDRGTHEIFFPSVKAFLKQHKMTGAVASSGSVSWGREKYLRFVEEYEKSYRTAEGIKASYTEFFACGEKL